jgi:hypothetical protein
MAIVRGKFETAREMAYGDIDSVMTQIGDAFDRNFSIAYIQNYTDVMIDFSISFDGANVCFTLDAGEKMTADMITNSLQVSQGEAAWCQYRDGAPSSGFVQVSVVCPA